MIVELFKYLTNPAPSYVKKLGYLKESIAIEARYNRNKSAWEDHLDISKKFIIDASKNLSNKRTVVILGSGSLYDVPLSYLSNSFNEVILVDIFHLKSTKRKVEKFKNVKLLEKDLTGIANKLYQNYTKRTFILPSPMHDFSFIKKEVDLVVSLNLLPQLPLLPKRFIEEYFSKSKKEVNEYCFSIINSHYEFLQRLSCEVCLIAEKERAFRNKKNEQIESKTALFGLELPPPSSEWNWEIAPIGEYSSQYSIRNRISGYYKSNL